LEDECAALFDKTPRSAEKSEVSGGRSLHIINLEPVLPGVTRARFKIDGQDYDIEAPFDPEGLLPWLPDYVEKAPDCTVCNRLVFPGQKVSQGHSKPEDSGFSHVVCCDTLAGYAGCFDNNGELVPAF
jgi:hypothetical protein